MSVAYAPDNEQSNDESFDRFYSSSDKENVIPGRKRMLDDALFGFFRKEAVKSLKTEFSKFSVVLMYGIRKSYGHMARRDDFIAYSLKYFWDVINSLSCRRKEVISKYGFGCLLLFGKCEIPSVFVRWLTSCVDHVSSQIIVDGCKILSISKDFVHHVIGLQNSGSIPMADSEGGAKFLISIFGVKQLPHITFFGNKLKSKEVLSEKEVFVCFMVVAFKCFLFPTVDEYPNIDFVSILQDPSSAIGVDLCLLVYEHFISGVSKFSMCCKLNGRKPKQFEFCHYALSVYYLDSLDFGARNLPRISVWKGNLIKFFSDLDFKKNNLYGKRQLKKILPQCYREFGSISDLKSDNDDSNVAPEPCLSAEFKDRLHKKFGSTFDAKMIDGIIDSVCSVQFEKLGTVHKCELLVTNVLNVILGFKSSEFKAPIDDTNGRARDKCSTDHGAVEAGNELSDIASQLPHISPNVFSKTTSTNIMGNIVVHNYGSPDLLACKSVGVSTFSTAPVMHPMHKVRSRLAHTILEEAMAPSLNTYPAGVKHSRSPSVINSHIPRINFSPSPKDKERNASPSSKVVLPANNQHGRNLTSNGSKLAPIPVPDLSPKPAPDRNASCSSKLGLASNNHCGRNVSSNGSKLAPIPIADVSPKPPLVPQCPDVEIIGTSTFSFRQAELAKRGDKLYNSMSNISGTQDVIAGDASKVDDANIINYIDLDQDAFEERPPKDDLVILQPKQSLALSLVQNDRFHVSDLDIKHYCSIVDLAYLKGIQKSYAVKFTKVHCSFITLGQSLMVGGHVDNFLIPVFCRKLFEDNHPNKSRRHHFFSLVGECILDYKNDDQLAFVSKAFLGAASASKGKRLKLSDRLFFPICRMRHWFTFSVDFKKRAFIFLDSLFKHDDDFHTSIKSRLINNFVTLWKVIFHTDDSLFRDFGVLYANVPKQDNADDCGIFTMKLMEIYKPELDIHRYFGKVDSVNIRIQYANKLFFCTRNNVDKSVVTDYVPQ